MGHTCYTAEMCAHTSAGDFPKAKERSPKYNDAHDDDDDDDNDAGTDDDNDDGDDDEDALLFFVFVGRAS
jgi:hypothetical protein